MRMSDFVVREAIMPSLEATTKEDVIRELIQQLATAKQIAAEDVEEIVSAIQRREALGSTGIGRGVAIPHTKHPCVEKLVGTVAISDPGVPFESLDGEPVHVFVLLVSPQNAHGDHLRALENISKKLRDDLFVKSLRAADTPELIWGHLEDEA